MAMPPMDEKGKNAMAIAVVLLLAAGAYWYYMWSPNQVKLTVVATHADSLDSLNAKTKKDVSKTNQAKLRADAVKYTDELLGLRRLVPTENEVPVLLDAVTDYARQVGLDVSEFAEDGTLPGDDFDMKKYRFGVIGPFHKVGQLLSSIASSPRIISPINVNISLGGPTLNRRPKEGEAFVNVRFGIVTYVAKTKLNPPPPVAAPAKQGAT
jgi:type IV pilus assembly protein PilO